MFGPIPICDINRIRNPAGAPAVSDLGIISLNSAVNGTRPYKITTSGVTQLTVGEWPSPVVSGQSASQDALIIPQSGSKLAAMITSNINVALAGLYACDGPQAITGTWTLKATSTDRVVTEGMILIDASASSTRYGAKNYLYRLVLAGGPATPSTVESSTDGGTTWSSAVSLAGSWSYSGGGYYLMADGTGFVVVGQYGGGGSGEFKFSIDHGATWSAYQDPGIGNCPAAIGYQPSEDLIVLISKSFAGTFSATATLYTSPRTAIAWTSRQTFACVAGSVLDVGLLTVIDSYLYLSVRLNATGWHLYRCLASNTASASPMSSVHNPAGTAVLPSRPIKLADNNLYYVLNNQCYLSTDGGSTWAAHGSAMASCGNQIGRIG